MDAVSAAGWDPFVRWAQQFSTTPNFELDEHVNKMRAVERIREARLKLQSGDFWLDTFMRGFRTPDNLVVPQKVYVPFLDWLSKNVGPATGALRDLWQLETTEHAARAIDTFWSFVPDKIVADLDNRANVASFLLAAIDSTQFPIYRGNAMDSSYEQTLTEEPSRDATPGERYAFAVQWLDGFIEHARERDFVVADRLTAAALAAAVTTAPVRPGHWSLEAWDEFVAYRSTPKRVAQKAAQAAARAAASGAKTPAKRSASGSSPRIRTPKAAVVKPTRAPRGVCPLCGSDEDVRLVGPTEDGRWAFVCEGGFAHGDDFAFTMKGV